ncbi:hypothetical protein FA95DRAFT_1471633, partial [Auriscalpium vulgare]
MVSAQMLAQISKRLCEAKASKPGAKDLPFGGVNIIFTGDFAQLPPVLAKSLYAVALTKKIDVNQGQTLRGQDALSGAYLWRLVSKSVMLQKNMRQASDPVYAGIVGRVRQGKATIAPINGMP